MTTKTPVYPVYGIIADHYGDEDYYVSTIPFYKDAGKIIYKHTPASEETAEIGKGEKSFLRELDTEAVGSLNQIIILTGDNFKQKLDFIGMENDIGSWELSVVFRWKLSTPEEYNKQLQAIRDAAVAWLTSYVQTEAKPAAEDVATVRSLIHTSGHATPADFVLTALASRLAEDEYSFKMETMFATASFADSPYNSVEEFLADVDALLRFVRESPEPCAGG